MANDQVSLPYFLAIMIFSGLIIRYLFFSSPQGRAPTRTPEALQRSRELAVERIQQMFPQAERRSILWDLQRNGGNIQNTTERILAGRLETVSLPRLNPTFAKCIANCTIILASRDISTTCAPWTRQLRYRLCYHVGFIKETEWKVCPTRSDYTLQSQGQVEWRGGEGHGQGQRLEFQPRRKTSIFAEASGRNDSGCAKEDGGKVGC